MFVELFYIKRTKYSEQDKERSILALEIWKYIHLILQEKTLI